MGISAVMVDQREPDWVKNLAFCDVPKIVTLLEVGDLHVACDDGALLVIERKTPGDMLNSLADDRLFRQCAAMQALSRFSYLVITDEIHRGPNGKVIAERETGWGYGTVWGALLSIQEMGTFVIFAGGDMDFEACIERLAARHHNDCQLIKPTRPPKTMSLAEQFLCGLPGMGPERTEKLMDYCGSAKMALWALTGNDPIPGIPENVKRSTRKLLSLEDGEQLVPIVP